MNSSKQVFAALVLIVAALGPIRAPAAQDSEQPHSPTSTYYDFQAGAKAELELRDWYHCPSPNQMPPPQSLCDHAGKPIEGALFRTVRDILRTGVSDADRLCSLDAAVTWSYNNCSPEVPGVSLMAEAVRLLAGNWRQHGELERADQLYTRANALRSTDLGVLGRIAVMQDWASLKVELGDVDGARYLADMQTTLARMKYEAQAGDARPEVLIDALLFQARILQELGLASNAQAAREEAKRLSSE
jgi:hypothetical protein